MSITLLTEAELGGHRAIHRTKKELLEDTEKKDVHRFFQIDGWAVDVDMASDMMTPDDDGHCIMSGIAHDLRRSGTDLKVRVQISNTATTDEVIVILQKIVWHLENPRDEPGILA